MFTRRIAILATLCCLFSASARSSAAEKLYSGSPIRALLITGGCCHNYPLQSQALTNAVSKLADVNWTILNEGGRGTRAMIDLYNNPNWAKPYDVIVHNECFADTDDPEYLRKITAAHKAGRPAVVIHCAMHSYRAAKVDDWREFLGVTSRRHEALRPYVVKPVLKEHPLMHGFPAEWTTPSDELYVIEKLWPKAQALAVTFNEKTKKDEPVVWVNDYQGTRVFGTTYGHSDATFGDPIFLGYVSRGILWAAGKIE